MEQRKVSLTVTEATAISNLMDNRSTFALHTLGEVKQCMVDREDYEVLVEFKELERLHEIEIPFKV